MSNSTELITALVEVQCRQIAAVIREAFGIAKVLGAASDKARCSA